MDYTKYFCPVCNEKFDENSDVVVCPECGTPHHRACWFEFGKCFNADHHSQNDNLGSNYVIEAAEEAQEETEIPHIEAEQINEGTEGHFINDNIPENENPAEKVLIDGRPVVLYEIAVGKNQKYYIPRFLAIEQFGSKARVWNFWACLVPLAWCLYRKMYKLCAGILAIYVLIFAVSGYFIYTNEAFLQANAECAAEDPMYYQNILSYDAGEQVVLTAKQQKLMEVIENIQIPSYISIGISVLLITCRILLGIKADFLYKKKIAKAIEKGEAIGLKEDALKMYVFRKNGIMPIVIPALVGFFEWFMVY